MPDPALPSRRPAPEYKAAPTEFQPDATTEGRYKGYFSIFGNRDDDGDVVLPGAFTKTLRERGPGAPRNRIQVFFAHDPMRPIGPPPDVLVEDSKGLYAEGRLSLGTTDGANVWALMKDGALTEGSFGYIALPAATKYSPLGRTLGEVMLLEISPVPLGANPQTEIAAVKSALRRKDFWAGCDLTGMDAASLLHSLVEYVLQTQRLTATDPATLLSATDLLADMDGVVQALLAQAALLPQTAATVQVLLAEAKAGRTISAATAGTLRSVLTHLEAAEEAVTGLLGLPPDATDTEPDTDAAKAAPAAARRLPPTTRLRLALVRPPSAYYPDLA